MLPTLTIDIGTTSVKLRLFGVDGDTLAATLFATPTRSDAFGEIYDVESLKRLIGDFVRALDPRHRELTERIAIAGVGESGGLVRSDGSLASPMILWHDHRGADRLAALDTVDRALVYRVTGLPVNANYGLSKVAWAVDNAGGDAAGAQWLNIAEYLAAWMSGVRWSEYSLASRTMALDLATRTWSREVCALVGLDPSVFPELRHAVDGEPLRRAFARELGLGPEVRVHVAGHDHMVGAIAADLRRGELLNSTGTTEGLLVVAGAPSTGENTAQARLANGVSCTGADFTLFASIPTGGSAFATLQELLGIDSAALTACVEGLAERYVAGGIDLGRIPLVLPQFRGSPPPEKRASARGAIAGLSTDTTADEVVFGCFLGLALQFLDVLELFPDRAERIKVIGPASRNPLWLHLKADLLGTPLSVSRVPEVVSLGAQALASGEQAGWDLCDPHEVAVDRGRHERLVEWRDRERARWEHLKGMPA
ncbi:FGGY-family carbohydrate kinase [Leifsonia poae]|uniref:FGGY-family carbohydrate kinase n=1 Tax=Leifsonia poae TaxID=110933 RepID=UPI001CBFAAD3|nr:FGGY family carbohydrate kinase [Leifsonia poae]